MWKEIHESVLHTNIYISMFWLQSSRRSIPVDLNFEDVDREPAARLFLRSSVRANVHYAAVGCVQRRHRELHFRCRCVISEFKDNPTKVK